MNFGMRLFSFKRCGLQSVRRRIGLRLPEDRLSTTV